MMSMASGVDGPVSIVSGSTAVNVDWFCLMVYGVTISGVSAKLPMCASGARVVHGHVAGALRVDSLRTDALRTQGAGVSARPGGHVYGCPLGR